MNETKQLDKIRYHWYCYVARGGLSRPRKLTVGQLEAGGLAHWTLFLNLSKDYVLKYPNSRHLLEDFVPTKLVSMLVGE